MISPGTECTIIKDAPYDADHVLIGARVRINSVLAKGTPDDPEPVYSVSLLKGYEDRWSPTTFSLVGDNLLPDPELNQLTLVEVDDA